MSFFTLDLRIKSDTPIEDAVSEAMILSKQLGVNISFKLSTHALVTSESNFDDVVNAYNEKVEQLEYMHEQSKGLHD